MRHKALGALLAAWTAAAPPKAAAAAVVNLDESTTELQLWPLGAVTYTVTDQTAAMPPPSAAFLPATARSLGLVFGTLWLQFEAQAAANLDPRRSFRLEVPSQPAYAKLFRRGDDKALASSGQAIPLARRPLAGSTVVFPLVLAPGERATYVLRLESRYPMTTEVSLFSDASWEVDKKLRLLSFALYAGAIASLLLFNFLIFLIYPEQTERLYFVVTQGAVHIGLPANLLGFTIYLWPTATDWDFRLRYILVGLGATSLALFSTKFLSLRAKAPRLNFAILAGGATAMIAAGVAYSAAGTVQVAVDLFLFIYLAMVLAVGCYALKRGDRAARWFVSGTGTLLVCCLVYLLMIHGLWSLPFFDARSVSVLQAGSFVDALLLDLAITEQITQERQRRFKAEQALRLSLADAYNAAETANRAKSEFLRNMSHELRTPLTSLVGFSDILLEGSDDPTEARTVATVVKRQAEHLTALVSDILDYANLEKAQMKFHATRFDLLALLSEVRDFFLPAAAEKGVPIELTLQPSTPEMFVGDRFRIRQILMNVIGNACKFTKAGVIRVDVSGQTDPLAWVRIRVADTGPGIAPECQASLFKPFYQADSSLTRAHEGTGLGLTLSRNLARFMGGDLRLTRSAPGKGAEFEIDLREFDGAARR